ncbi:glycoside hydrolase [Adhaeretor mobilis]|uniref:glycoside hydrolase n=1 Tax=Adhaeretor mobilis TaxID=1930276 RepID=UPI001C54CDFC|nr:glycoside hydrolase [Adhaeretor mobilis]
MSFLRILFALLAIVAYCSSAPLARAIDIGTTTSYHNHRFEYWGTSLAWWGNEVGGQSNAQGREDLVDIFFDPNNGLGMNFLRYNIGAGSNPDTSIQNITRPGAKMDGWVPDQPTDFSDTSTWQWDWNADATQRLILDMAIDHGVSNVEAFANSAPWWLTRNLQSNGISGGGSNLSTARNDEFAHYMLEVVDHFETNLGIHFETLAPMNEPGSGFWNGNSNQEGMGVPAGFYQDRLIKEFGSEIANRGTNIKLVGLEETSTDQSADSWNNGSLTNTAKSYLSQVNTHSYGFNGASLPSDSQNLFNAVSPDGLKIYATEYGTGQGATRLARQINNDIRYLDAAGWTYWQAIEDNNGSGWGLALSNFNGNNPRFDVQDQYFAFKQYSAFIRPGSEIIELANQDDITAAYDPRTGITNVVVNNEGGDNTSQQYSFDVLDRQVLSTRLIRTTDEDNSLRTDAYAALGPATASNNNVSFDAVGNAVTSVVIYHRPNLVENPSLDLGSSNNGTKVIAGWQAEGNALFANVEDNSGDGSGSALMLTNSVGNTGRISQSGIGDADVDLTGVAYQLSLDVQFANEDSAHYDADTYLALEFYGADDETLASISLQDSETEIDPAFAVKRDGFESSVDGSDPNDTVYRTYLSGRFVAPEGTRFVRPVIRFDGVESGSNNVVNLDNVRLQEVHPEATARVWNAEGSGDWSGDDNWTNHAKVDNNAWAYFGNAIDQASTVTIASTTYAQGVTFFSDHEYQLQGSGQLTTGHPTESSAIDARMGSHRISVDTSLVGSVDVQVLPGASLVFDGGLDLNGHDLTKLGAGLLDLSVGFEMGSGQINSYTTLEALIAIGSDAVLDGDFQLLLAPGQTLELGDTFELLSYNSLSDTFDNLFLPSLADGLAWDIDYGASLLMVEIVNATSEGDFDGDGNVDGVDFLYWQQHGLSASELTEWQDNYGSMAPQPSSAVVPEPSTFVLCFFAITIPLSLATLRNQPTQKSLRKVN